ncbi:MAG TPA: arginine--tRNA ligase [Steroidobacteraceae bacterium]|nr:arginine--tRNA ligase [Steroidobacteraceae bacterium]
MKQLIEKIVQDAFASLPEDLRSLDITQAPSTVERTRDPGHGDFASNVAMQLAKAAGRKPRELAQAIVAALPANELIGRVEIAGPGFINFFLAPAAYHTELRRVLDQAGAYGRSTLGAGERVIVEFVSANPTGPLHVGHGRHAAFGASVANLLDAIGYNVHREYYINDAGRQMEILAASVWLRYLECFGERFAFPSNGYRGDYIQPIADKLIEREGRSLLRPAADVFRELPPDAPAGDKDLYIDAVIARARSLIGEDGFQKALDLALGDILADIREDLETFGVCYDEWFSERSLTEQGAIERALERLRANGVVYQKDGAEWFRATDFGDEKDRVVVRENGAKTYFASDIAYHLQKRERGFEHLIDVLGADHHGYVARVRAGLVAMGEPGDALEVKLVQFVTLYRGGEKVQMSTRSGEFITLRELRREVGNDAARFFYVMRSNDQHLDFDMQLATSRSNENPVYYIQYAHARVCSVLRQMGDRSMSYDPARGREALSLLVEPYEQALLTTLSRYPEVVESAALQRAPHAMVHYLRELANDFHTYYNAHQFLVEDAELRDARLTLILGVRQVIRNGLGLLGVFAPEAM